MIDDALFALLNTRCDVVLSAASARGVPSLCWGTGGHLLDDRLTVEAWVREDHGRQFLADLRETGRAAAVFNEPFTNIAVQFKGGQATQRAANADDAPLLQRHLDNMLRELRRLGHRDDFIRAFFEQPWSQLVVVRFAATQVFVQTPGPRAGRPMAGSLPARDAR